MVIAIVLVVLLLLFLLWLWLIGPQRPHRTDIVPFRAYDYAHRGLHDKSQGIPENSLPAFARAAEAGYGMELDIQLTKDKQVVVHHDPGLSRSCGEDRTIADMTLEQLQSCRLFGTEERVPLFRQVLETVQGRTPIIVELKGYNDPDELCTLAMRELDSYQGPYCIESFDPRIVRWFRKHRPEIVRGQLMCHFKKGDDGLTASQAFFGRNLMTNWYTRPDFEAYDIHTRDRLAMKTATGLLGMQEVSWTIRTQEEYRKAKALRSMVIFENIRP